MRLLRLGIPILALMLALWGGATAAQTATPPSTMPFTLTITNTPTAQPTTLWTPTITPTPTSQPAPPVLGYPPEGAVITQPITVQDLRYTTTGFVTQIRVWGGHFTARWCVELHATCYEWDFENGDVPLPDGFYRWQVWTSKPLGSAISAVGHFRVQIDDSRQLPPMLTATPQPTYSPTPRGR